MISQGFMTATQRHTPLLTAVADASCSIGGRDATSDVQRANMGTTSLTLVGNSADLREFAERRDTVYGNASR